MKLKNTIIHLIGFAGVGKYTIAKILHTQTEARIVDNHLINNPVFSVINLGDGAKLPEQIWIQTRKIRAAVLETIETLSPPDYSFIFTNILYKDDEVDRNILESIISLSEKRNATYVPARLYCSPEENIKRKAQLGRKERLKPTNTENVQKVHTENEIIPVPHKNLLNLDVTDLTAEETAAAILKHAENCLA